MLWLSDLIAIGALFQQACKLAKVRMSLASFPTFENNGAAEGPSNFRQFWPCSLPSLGHNPALVQQASKQMEKRFNYGTHL